MYEAKADGKGTYAVYDATTHHRGGRLQLASDVAQSVRLTCGDQHDCRQRDAHTRDLRRAQPFSEHDHRAQHS